MTRPRTAWQRVARGVLLLFLIAVAVLLVRYARSIRWREVGTTLASYDRQVLVAAIALVALSYVLYASYDLLARTYAGHRLSNRSVMAIAGISYAFNLNLGALVGGAGFRYRLYSARGLPAATITRILGFSVTTNWLGYIALAGSVFSAKVVAVPQQWSVGIAGMQALGALLLAATLAYFVACAVAHDRVLVVRGHEIRLPRVRLAFLQLAVAAANWLTIAAIVFVLLQQRIPFPTVLGVMLFAAIAGAMTHIPAGLGVIELVVLALLGDRLPDHELLAALLAYRGIYYIGPLLVALVLYARLEAIAGVARGTLGRSRKEPGEA